MLRKKPLPKPRLTAAQIREANGITHQTLKDVRKDSRIEYEKKALATQASHDRMLAIWKEFCQYTLDHEPDWLSATFSHKPSTIDEILVKGAPPIPFGTFNGFLFFMAGSMEGPINGKPTIQTVQQECTCFISVVQQLTGNFKSPRDKALHFAFIKGTLADKLGLQSASTARPTSRSSSHPYSTARRLIGHGESTGSIDPTKDSFAYPTASGSSSGATRKRRQAPLGPTPSPELMPPPPVPTRRRPSAERQVDAVPTTAATSSIADSYTLATSIRPIDDVSRSPYASIGSTEADAQVSTTPRSGRAPRVAPPRQRRWVTAACGSGGNATGVDAHPYLVAPNAIDKVEARLPFKSSEQHLPAFIAPLETDPDFQVKKTGSTTGNTEHQFEQEEEINQDDDFDPMESPPPVGRVRAHARGSTKPGLKRAITDSESDDATSDIDGNPDPTMAVTGPRNKGGRRVRARALALTVVGSPARSTSSAHPSASSARPLVVSPDRTGLSPVARGRPRGSRGARGVSGAGRDVALGGTQVGVRLSDTDESMQR